MRWADANATFQRELSAALGGVSILIYPSAGEIQPNVASDDLFFGKLALAVRDSPLRIDVSLGHSAAVHIDAHLAQPAVHGGYAGHAMGGTLRGIEIEKPSEPVIELVRRLAGSWLAVASDHQLALDDATQWRPLEHDRHWFVRSLDFDAHLSQLCGEPLGSLQLLSPSPLT